MAIIPYPEPPRGPLREISERLEHGMLTADAAKDLCAAGLEWNIVAPHVHDMDWWRDQPLNICPPAKQHWNINAWDATLRLATSDMILWVDPGPGAPLPKVAPELVLVTHAHADHTDQLQEWVNHFPEMLIVMTSITAQLLSLHSGGLGKNQQILDRIIIVDFNESRTISGVSIQFLPAGHLLGAAMLEIGFGPDHILVTGDFALRDVGGLPGGQIPAGEYAYILLESTECSRRSLPYADLRSTRTPFLNEVEQRIASQQCGVQINTHSFGQAQEAYVSLVMAQRAGAFSEHPVYVGGLAASVSSLYAKQLGDLSVAWNQPFSKLTDSVQGKYISIIPVQQQHGNISNISLLEHPSIFTHSGWAEKMALAMKASCHQLCYYHGFSTSLDIALVELGRKTGSLFKEIL